jgi:hypothetical protein
VIFWRPGKVKYGGDFFRLLRAAAGLHIRFGASYISRAGHDAPAGPPPEFAKCDFAVQPVALFHYAERWQPPVPL